MILSPIRIFIADNICHTCCFFSVFQAKDLFWALARITANWYVLLVRDIKMIRWNKTIKHLLFTRSFCLSFWVKLFGSFHLFLETLIIISYFFRDGRKLYLMFGIKTNRYFYPSKNSLEIEKKSRHTVCCILFVHMKPLSHVYKYIYISCQNNDNKRW